MIDNEIAALISDLDNWSNLNEKAQQELLVKCRYVLGDVESNVVYSPCNTAQVFKNLLLAHSFNLLLTHSLI